MQKSFVVYTFILNARNVFSRNDINNTSVDTRVAVRVATYGECGVVERISTTCVRCRCLALAVEQGRSVPLCGHSNRNVHFFNDLHFASENLN